MLILFIVIDITVHKQTVRNLRMNYNGDAIRPSIVMFTICLFMFQMTKVLGHNYGLSFDQIEKY